jgi:hypothetical protein
MKGMGRGKTRPSAMKIKLLKGVVAGGAARRPGDIVDVDDKQSAYLLANGKAVAVIDEDQPAPPATKRGGKIKES